MWMGSEAPKRFGLRLAGAIVAGLLLLYGCAPGRKAVKPRPEGWSDVGTASWYGQPFHGRRTANGDVYDMHLLTAAHRTLPFGTVLRVENLDNSREVFVRVNDRGPFVKGRILDLSYEAARRLGMDVSGLARVRITVTEDASTQLAQAGSYTLQVGAFQDATLAAALARDARRRGFDVRIEHDGPWSRVRVGSFASRQEAERELRRVEKRLGVRGVVVRSD